MKDIEIIEKWAKEMGVRVAMYPQGKTTTEAVSFAFLQELVYAAVEADRAQKVPEIDYEALIHAGWKNHRYAQGTRGCVAFKHGAQWFRSVLLASTPAPAQQSGWTEESGLVIDFANRVELSCYDQGSAECMAAVQHILDGKDRGDGVANEPWESIRRRLISLVAPAPAQQEPTEDAGITRGEWIGQAVRVYLAAGDTEADASECAAYLWREQDMADLEDPLEAALSDIEGRPTAQHQEPPQQERKISEALRRRGLSLVKTANGYDVLELGHITAQASGPQQERENAELVKALEEARKDAERYRCLKQTRPVLLLTGFFGNGCVNRTLEEVDAAIDASRAAIKEQT